MKKIILLMLILLLTNCVKNSKIQITAVIPNETESNNPIQAIKSNAEIKDIDYRNENIINKIALPHFRKINVLNFKNKLVVIGNQLVLDDGYDDKVQIWTSIDGIEWEKVIDNLMNPWKSSYTIANSQDRIVIVGGQFKDNTRSNELLYSDNIYDWKQVEQNLSIKKISGAMAFYFKNKFWLVGGRTPIQSYDIWNSIDGLTWIKIAYNLEISITKDNKDLNINDNYLIICDFSTLFKTTNGIEWEELNIDIEKILYDIENTEVDNFNFCYFNNNFYASACINPWAEDTGFTDGYVPTTVIYRSNNLTDWELLSKKKDIPYINGKSEYKLMYDSLPFHWNAGFISFKDHLYIIGTDGDVWRSKDGVKWELISGNLPVFENRGD